VLAIAQGCSSPSDSAGFTRSGGGDDGSGVGSEAGGLLPPLFDGGLLIQSDGSTAAGSCKAGHYTGTFAGTYSSFLTFVGVPIPVVGNVDLTLQQSVTSDGEFPMYTISNGTVSGTADGIVAQYQCDIVGTLDCRAKKLVNGGLRNCVYCVGTFFDDAGSCLGVAGSFEGPLAADYDTSTFSFVNGTWNGSEEIADGSAMVSDSGYLGPGNYGGNGTWSAQYTP
jgi:hypothetical protein